MASQPTGRSGNSAPKVTDTANEKVMGGVKKAADAVDARRGEVADALDTAAQTVDEQGKNAPEPVKGYAGEAKQKIEAAADYVRDHDAKEIGTDVYEKAKEFPLASVIIFGAVIVGGGLLLAAMRDQDDSFMEPGQQQPSTLAAMAGGLGPQATDTLTKMRDAAVSFALMKAIEAVDDRFPGFRQHFERL